MTRNGKTGEQHDYFEDFVDTMLEIRHSKREDYAGSDFTVWMANFVLSALLAGQSVKDSFRSLQATKVARIVALDQEGGAPNNEALTDTHIDLANYLGLMNAFIDEWGEEAANKPLEWQEVLRYIMAYLVGYEVPTWEELKTMGREEDAAQEPPFLTRGDVRHRTSAPIYGRGLDYYRKGAVRECRVSSGETVLYGRVDSLDSRYRWGAKSYDVAIQREHGEYVARCACPFDIHNGQGGWCKHAVALALKHLEGVRN